MPVCTASNLATLSVGFSQLTPAQREGIKVYLLAVRAGTTTDPEALLELADCYCGLSHKQLLAIQTFLLCQIVNGA